MKPEEPTTEQEKVKEIHHYHDRRPFNFGALFAGIILIVIGLAYLLNSLGITNISWNINWNIIWPVVIILIGLSILSRRGWVSILIGSIVTLIVIAIVLTSIFTTSFRKSSQTTNQTIQISKSENVKTSNININTGAIKVNITGGASNLIEGNLESNYLTLKNNSTVSADNQTIDIDTNGSSNFIIGGAKNNLNLKLNSDTPINLTIDCGAAALDLDLRDIQIKSLAIKTGASSVNIKFGDKFNTPVFSAKAGASSFNISFPSNFEAQASIKSGLSSKNLPGFNQLSDGLYKTANFDAADKKLDMTFDIGVSSLNITH